MDANTTGTAATADVDALVDVLFDEHPEVGPYGWLDEKLAGDKRAHARLIARRLGVARSSWRRGVRRLTATMLAHLNNASQIAAALRFLAADVAAPAAGVRAPTAISARHAADDARATTAPERGPNRLPVRTSTVEGPAGCTRPGPTVAA